MTAIQRVLRIFDGFETAPESIEEQRELAAKARDQLMAIARLFRISKAVCYSQEDVEHNLGYDLGGALFSTVEYMKALGLEDLDK